MDADPAIPYRHSYWLRRLIPQRGQRKESKHVIFNRQGGGRIGTLESRTRTGWPTVKAHGMLADKEGPLRLTAECCIY